MKLGVRALLGAARRLQRDANAIGLGGQRGSPEGIRPQHPGDIYDLLITSAVLRRASRELFLNRHYPQAVEQAYKCLNNAVKAKTKLPLDGQKLMTRAFSVEHPVLRLNGLQTESERDEQLGYMQVFAGCMQCIRNPRAHEDAIEDDPAVALEMLIWANHLLRVVEASTRARQPRRRRTKET